MDGGIRALIGGLIGAWSCNLMESNDPRISNASKTILPISCESLDFGEGPGAKDTKAPDWEVRHTCNRDRDHQCRYPNLVIEVAWTQTKEEMKEKSEFYSKHL
jgi:hypothetical protein